MFIKNKCKIRINDIKNNSSILAPLRYKEVILNSNFDSLTNLFDISNESINIKNTKKYYNYVEIGSINNLTGTVNPEVKREIDISTTSLFRLRADDIIVSTVRTYLGGIGKITNETENLVSSKALIVLRNLKKNRNLDYIFGIMKSKFFNEQVSLILNSSLYPRMDKSALNTIKIPFPTVKNNDNPSMVENLVSSIVQDILDKEKNIKIKNLQIDKIIEQELINNQLKNNQHYSYPKKSTIFNIKRLDTSLYQKNFIDNYSLLENYKHGFKRVRNYKYKIYSGATPIFVEKNIKQLPIFIRPTEMNYNRTYDKFINVYVKNKVKVHSNEGIIVPRKGGTYALYKPEGLDVIINDSLKFLEVDQDIVFISALLTGKNIQKYLSSVKSKANGGGLVEENIIDIPIPLFPKEVKEQIEVLYFNDDEKNENKGIYQLNKEIFEQKEYLESIIYKILMEEKIDLQ